jgi:hypothetical protein
MKFTQTLWTITNATLLLSVFAGTAASQMTDCLLPEDFRVYVSAEGGVVNWAAPEYTEKILPTVNKYMKRDGGYIACYSRNEKGSIYSVGGGIYVMGQIRLKGRYIGRIFHPQGFEGKDISAVQKFKTLCNQTFPAARSGGWAGGDTGGWFGIQ